ncbi:hypothetical protein FRC01_014909 [Tulasnella sp. 417]|nr:hypothetical protein FRC01_014909 [Tulasnella sp. 417]
MKQAHTFMMDSFLPHQDTEKADGMFATIVVVLPSSFTGGVAHLSHAGQSTIVDQGAGSLASTSVMAWYTDVMHEIKPIQSGYRLALSYNLIHTTTSLRPALTDTSEGIERLREILLSWKQHLQDEDSPEKIIYLLQHRYSHANYRGSALKGRDAQTVAILDSIGKEIGFRVGLALVECHLRGGADDGGNDYYAPPVGCWSSDDGIASEDLNFLETYETSMTITELVDLDGVLLKKKLKLTEEDEDGVGVEFIPADLREVVESGPHDAQEYEGYQGNGAGSLERWYRRTVLVVWPAEHDEQILRGPHYTRFVLNTLSKTSSSKPTEAERKILNYALGLPPKEPKMATTVLRGVCKAACVWRIPDLWCQAIHVCNGSEFVNKIGKELYLEALACLPTCFIVPSIRQALHKDPENVTRLGLLEFLEQRLSSQGIPAGWIKDARKDVLATLRPLVTADCEPILEAVASLGGMADLDSIVMPQLRNSADSVPLATLATALFREITRPGTSILVSADGVHRGCTVIQDLLTLSIERAQLFALTPPKHGNGTQYSYYPTGALKPSPDLTLILVKACITTRNDPLIRQISNKLAAFSPSDPPNERQIRAESVYIPLVTLVQDFIERRSSSLPEGLQLLYKEVLPLMLAKPNPNEAELALMVRVAKQCNDLNAIIQSTVSQFKALPREPPTVKTLVREFRGLMTEHPAVRGELEPVIGEMIMTMIKALQPRALQGQAAIVDWLDYCAENDSIDSCAEIISRVTHDASSANGNRLTLEFLPLLPTLMSWLSRRGKPHTDQPFPLLVRTVVLRWLQTVLGTTKLADVVQMLASIRNCRCICRYCAPVMRWLAEPSQGEEISLECIGAPNVNHLEKNLRNYVRKLVDWTILRTSPHGIRVVKNDRIYKAQMWSTNQAAGVAAVRAISADEGVLLSILGEEIYKTVVQMLDVPYINTEIGIMAGTSAPTNQTPAGLEGAGRPRGNSSVQPPPKRRRVDENIPVIDLTTP